MFVFYRITRLWLVFHSLVSFVCRLSSGYHVDFNPKNHFKLVSWFSINAHLFIPFLFYCLSLSDKLSWGCSGFLKAS